MFHAHLGRWYEDLSQGLSTESECPCKENSTRSFHWGRTRRHRHASECLSRILGSHSMSHDILQQPWWNNLLILKIHRTLSMMHFIDYMQQLSPQCEFSRLTVMSMKTLSMYN
ncbi:hypothetical protein MPTK1_2g24700 [Marchantia polymorpha subsp. ruderalis]|uniref:Uncharacterized protein n=1 Tax=Marchantia polymorpha TaxID=3197 RepID=A0A2R6W0A9_MARPO|nr:hypothetical protein MARPO_0207s0008 [Marchantia polymorpha]BBN03585.1 hypothetical protein Mp_2g24700 [Marchantia polymorpha subsp. ruderalis]|eukprot:PTQ27298.1 hypothetical protein MARPO_0207s0008 [Marchantia polymorpha]